MATLEEILAFEYTGDDEQDFQNYLQVHWFIMDKNNSIKDRATAMRDMSVRGFHYPVYETDDQKMIQTYVDEIAFIFLAANDPNVQPKS